jgi:hypothetical protein
MRLSLKASVTRKKKTKKNNSNEQPDLNIAKSKERHFILDRKAEIILF